MEFPPTLWRSAAHGRSIRTDGLANAAKNGRKSRSTIVDGRFLRIEMRLRALRARSSRGGLPAQETFPAKYRPSLSRLKGHRGFPAALRTGGHGFGAKRTRRRAPLALGF